MQWSVVQALLQVLVGLMLLAFIYMYTGTFWYSYVLVKRDCTIYVLVTTILVYLCTGEEGMYYLCTNTQTHINA